MTKQEDQRVEVWDGSGEEYLGEGVYVGDVAIYCIQCPDGSLRSLTNAEEVPDTEMVEQANGKLKILPDNPKIILDSGKVVYGCQVWWQPLAKEPFSKN